jgi:hypothetical protein
VAYCQVEPTHRFFWQEVAARVGSRSANECFAKIFDAARSPAAGAKLPRAKTVVSAPSCCTHCLHVWMHLRMILLPCLCNQLPGVMQSGLKHMSLE